MPTLPFMKYCIIFLISLWTLNSSAQSYTKMLGETNSWVTHYIGLGIEAAHQISTSLDTQINGKKYYRMLHDNQLLLGFLREDSVNKKIFFAETGPNDSVQINTDALLYDFSLNVGDTTIIHTFEAVSSFNRIDTLRLDSIGTEKSILFGVLLAPDSLRLFYLSHLKSSVFDKPIVWIEGMGSYLGLQFPSEQVNLAIYLHCFSRDSMLEFRRSGEWGGDSCYQNAIAGGGLISIEEDFSESSINLFQNGGNLLITTSEPNLQITSIRIIDLNGRELLKQHFSTPESEFQFDISHFPQGLYYVQVMGEDGFYAKSFVKIE